MTNDSKIWLERLSTLKIEVEINVGQEFKYNNKDFDLTYKCTDKKPIYSKTKSRNVESTIYILSPSPNSYEFRGKTYYYKTLEMHQESIWDYLWRQVFIRL